jgi:hypothetical protein
VIERQRVNSSAFCFAAIMPFFCYDCLAKMAKRHCIGWAMNRKLLAFVTSSVLVGATLIATPAEARRLFWWQSDRASGLDVYGNYPDEQDAYIQDQFNQEEYDLYMEQTHRRHRQRYDRSYFDPQVDDPYYYSPRHRIKKKKTAHRMQMVKPAAKQVALSKSPAIVEKRVEKLQTQNPKTASITKRFSEPGGSKAIDCTKGASIVAGFGFDAVTTKNCSGGTLVYSATRSGRPFEVQVNSSSGELTAVKKL